MNTQGWLSVPQAAEHMGVSRTTAWRRLVAFQNAHPEREVLRGYAEPGKRTGKLLVCARALLETMHRDREDMLETTRDRVEEIDSRVGSLETLLEVVKIRLRKLEKANKSSETMRELAQMESRLVALGCNSLRKSRPNRAPEK